MDKQLIDQLAHFIDGRVCLLGIGNRYQSTTTMLSDPILQKHWNPGLTTMSLMQGSSRKIT